MGVGHQLGAAGAQGKTFPGIWKHVSSPGILGVLGGAEGTCPLMSPPGTLQVNRSS